MSKISVPTLLASVILTALVGPAYSAPTFIGSAVGTWQNLQASGTGNVDSITNHDTSTGGSAVFSFGQGSGTGPNTFSFNGLGSDPSIAGFSASANTPFDIGHFSYFNGNTTSYPDTSAIDLGIGLNLTAPTMTSSNFAFDFGITLTPNNTGNPVADGDIVSITNAITSTNFSVSGTAYTLQLLGFSTTGGTSFTSQFLSPEGSTAKADIYATITTNVMPVPEPSTIALFGSGLLAIGMIRRRKNV